MKEYIFFTGGTYSNWCHSPFQINGIRFDCVEQYMMYEKAMLFDDIEAANMIMRTLNPSRQKAIGRSVRNYNETVWASKRFEIVLEGILQKFLQNKHMKEELLLSGNKHIVEAAPWDNIWGIGMADSHPDILDESKWRGKNLLGKAIMVVRDILRDILRDKIAI
ncbi:MAG: GTP cyclohydrolase [Hyphomicrobiales bacterium]|nr:MAG: GTP cyclohydrolase [Hyphomicrobiales bacterium]